MLWVVALQGNFIYSFCQKSTENKSRKETQDYEKTNKFCSQAVFADRENGLQTDIIHNSDSFELICNVGR